MPPVARRRRTTSRRGVRRVRRPSSVVRRPSSVGSPPSAARFARDARAGQNAFAISVHMVLNHVKYVENSTRMSAMALAVASMRGDVAPARRLVSSPAASVGAHGLIDSFVDARGIPTDGEYRRRGRRRKTRRRGARARARTRARSGANARGWRARATCDGWRLTPRCGRAWRPRARRRTATRTTRAEREGRRTREGARRERTTRTTRTARFLLF